MYNEVDDSYLPDPMKKTLEEFIDDVVSTGKFTKACQAFIPFLTMEMDDLELDREFIPYILAMASGIGGLEMGIQVEPLCCALMTGSKLG